MTRTIGLIRVSQRNGDANEHSPEVQMRGLEKHCADEGWTLDPRDVWDENVDPVDGKVRKVSGSWDLSDRPRLAAAIEAVERGTHQVILAERFDRLFRNLDVQREAIRRVEAAGGQLATVKQGAISHATAESELHANIDGVISQYQKRTATERAWAAVEIAIEQGKAPGPAPLGLRRGPDGVFVPGPAKEIEIVRAAFALRDSGAPVKDVRAYLAEHGVERTVTGVRKMLASRLYIGEIHYGKHTPNLHAPWGPIVDRDVFERVGKMVVPAGRKAKCERLLSRQAVLRCGTCGGRMSASATGSRPTTRSARYAFYRCANDDCPRRVTISADPIERDIKQAVIEYWRDARGHASVRQQARKAEKAAREAHDTHAAFVSMLDPREPSHVAREAELRATRDARRAEAERLGDALPEKEEVDAERVFAEGSMDRQRQLIRRTVVQATVAPGRASDRVVIELVGVGQ